MQMKWLAVATAILLLTGCANSAAQPPVENQVEAPGSEIEQVEVIEDLPAENEQNVVEESEPASAERESEEAASQAEEPAEAAPEGPYAPLTGLPVTEADIQRRPMAVMLDNHFGARPQAGLDQADIVYEILAEGWITRYMAIFHANTPESVGPIRSARPYFIDKALEYDPYYVHVGGSMQALSDVILLNMADIDGLSSGSNVFWRKSHKKIPHNMYGSDTSLRKEADRRGHRVDTGVSGIPVATAFSPIGGESCTKVRIRYKQPTSKDTVGYYASWQWDEELQQYGRYVNGKPHLDEVSEQHLTASNVLIQFASHKVIDNEGRRKIGLIGEGNGWFLSGGEKLAVTWKKNDRRDKTRFYDENGDEIELNPGVTWYQVVPAGLELGW